MKLEELILRNDFDIAWIESIHTSHYLPLLRRRGIPVVIRVHNVESIIAQRFSNHAGVMGADMWHGRQGRCIGLSHKCTHRPISALRLPGLTLIRFKR